MSPRLRMGRQAAALGCGRFVSLRFPRRRIAQETTLIACVVILLGASLGACSQGRVGEAIPGSAEQIFLQGVRLLEAGRREEAHDLFVDLTRTHSRFPDAYRLLHQMGAEEGRLEETNALFDVISARDPRNGLPLAYKAINLVLLGRMAEANAAAKMAILADPDDVDLYEPLGYWLPFEMLSPKDWDDWVRSERKRLGGGDLLSLLLEEPLPPARESGTHASRDLTCLHTEVNQVKAQAMSGELPQPGILVQKYKELLRCTREIGSPQAVASAASEVAWAYEYAGDRVQAVRKQLEAMDVARHADHRQLIAHAQRNLARLAIKLNDLPEARRRLEQAAPLVRLYDAPRGQSELATIWGHYYAAAGEHERAIERYEAALAHWRRTGFWTIRTVSTMAALGRMLTLSGAHDRAARQLREAEGLARELQDRRGRATVRLEQARLALAHGHPLEAIPFIEQGLTDDAATGSLIRTELLASLIRAREASGQPEKAIGAGLEWARAVRSSVNVNLPGQELETFFEDKAVTVEEILSGLRRRSGPGDAGLALDVAASLQALALRHHLSRKVLPVHQEPSGALRRLLARRGSAGDGDPLAMVIWTGERKSFLWLISPGDIGWWTLPGRRTLAGEVDRRLEWLIGPPQSTSGDAGTWGRETPAVETTFPFLPREVVARLQRATSLLVAVDGPLARFPLEMLRLPDGRRFIEQGTVTYAPAIALAPGDVTHRRIDGGRARIYAFPSAGSDPPGVSADDGGWECLPLAGALDRALLRRRVSRPPLLPGAAQEARLLAAQLERAGYQVEVSTLPSRDDLLRQDGGGGEVLHLATHACVDKATVNNSYLVVAPRAPEEGTWEPLFAREIAAADLRYRLVVLSGCRTFEGREVAGEGMTGLARAFHAGGVPYVVSTLWDVQDLATRMFMEAFFQRLTGGDTVEGALRGAQLMMLASDRPLLRHPHFWAAFRLTWVAAGPSPLEAGPAPDRRRTPS